MQGDSTFCYFFTLAKQLSMAESFADLSRELEERYSPKTTLHANQTARIVNMCILSTLNVVVSLLGLSSVCGSAEQGLQRLELQVQGLLDAGLDRRVKVLEELKCLGSLFL